MGVIAPLVTIGSAIASGVAGASQSGAASEARFRAADVGRARAEQVDFASRDELRTTLGNILAIRAATGADVNSPTTMAVMDNQRVIGERNRQTRVLSERMKAEQAEAEGRAYQKAGMFSLAGGLIKAIPGFGSLFGSMNFGGAGGGASYASGGAASP